MAAQAPASALTVTRAGQVMVGGWLSCTTTNWLQVALLPWLSVTVQMTVLVPASLPSPLNLESRRR